MASFAKSQLLKYGWTEGKGLGKHENGIVEPVRPKFKFDTAGLGQDTKEYAWWENVYNTAAKNVQIDTEVEGVSIKIKDEDAVDISTRKIDTKKLKKMLNLHHENFLKTCTLNDGKLTQSETQARPGFLRIACEPPQCQLSDSELFEVCGGRTAHKGARHGLTLSGKLARIARQEAELLGQKPQRSLSESTDWQEVKVKSKRKRRLSAAEMDLDGSQHTDANANTLSLEVRTTAKAPFVSSRRESNFSKRKEKRRLQDLVQQLGSVALTEGSLLPETETKKKKAKKLKKSATETSSSRKKDERSRGERKNRENEETNENKNPRVLPTSDLVDGSIVTLDNDGERETNPPKKRKVEVTEAERLNNRIARKKLRHHEKMQRRRVDRLSECLMAVNLCEDSVDSGRGEDLIESCNVSKKLKKWKKHRKEKRDRKMEGWAVLDA